MRPNNTVPKTLYQFATEPFNVILITLILASVNLGLINRRLAFQNEFGSNLLSLRDISLLLVLAFGFAASRRLWGTNGLTKTVTLVVMLTPLAALVGLSQGAPMAWVGIEFVNMTSWALAIVVAAQLKQHPMRLKLLMQIIVVVGLLVGIGVFVEVLTSVAVVTADTFDVGNNKRSTPTGFPFVMLAISILLVELLDKQAKSRRATLVTVGMLGILVMATLLTQSRTYVVGIVFGTACYLVGSAFYGVKKVRWANVGLAGAASAIALALVLFFGNSWFRDGFDQQYIERYGMDSRTRGRTIEKFEKGQRLFEVRHVLTQRLPNSPFIGDGLGTQSLPKHFGKRTFVVHSSLAFWPLRYGVVGILAFAAFVWCLLTSLKTAVCDSSSLGTMGRGISVGMLNLVGCSLFGNIFGVTYGVQQAMIGLACLIAYQCLHRELLHRKVARTDHQVRRRRQLASTRLVTSQ